MATKLISLSNSLHDAVWLYERLAYASSGDGILLLSDAVSDLHSPISLASFIAKAKATGVDIYALKEDLEIRGVNCNQKYVDIIDYAGFVQLVIHYDSHVAW